MKKLSRIKKIVCTLGVFACGMATGLTAQATNGKKSNILLILSDDQSVPFVGCYGYPDLTTPNLDNLAKEGIRFDNAYTCASQCVPSRASILSGRNVVDIHMSRFSAPLPREVKTIPEYLREAGYYTGICGRHYHLDGSERMPQETTDAFEKYGLVTFQDRVDYLNIGADDEVLGQFQEFLDQQPGDKPFFMWMNYSDPHRPFTARKYEPDPEKLKLPDIFPDTEEVRKDLSQHLGEINRVDFHIGQVIDELKKRKLTENTIIVFMGDNGAALLRGKGTLYDIGLHVPLIVNGKGVEKGTVSKAMVSGIDMAPTLLEIAGVKKPEPMTGKSFFPVLKGKEFEGHQYIFGERVPHSSGLPTNTAYFDLGRTVFDRRYKLIYNALYKLPYDPVDFINHPLWKDLKKKNANGELKEKYSKAFFSDPRSLFELFDLKNDPGEFKNLDGNPEYAEIEHHLKAVLHEWMIVNKDYLPLPIPPR